jgi:phosphomevalonate kinase
LSASEFSQTVNNLPLWDTKVTSFSLPSGIYLTLADIQHGSHTPSMVTKLLNWRKSNPEVATPIWQGLNKKNLLVTELLIKLQGLYELDNEGYESSLNWASSINFDKVITLLNKFYQLLITFL